MTTTTPRLAPPTSMAALRTEMFAGLGPAEVAALAEAAGCPAHHLIAAAAGVDPGTAHPPVPADALASTARTVVDSTTAAPVIESPAAAGLGSTPVDAPVTDATPPQEPTAGAGFAPPPWNLTIHFDPLSYAAYDNPYELFRRLRNEAPVYYNADRDLYIVSRYEDVREGLKDSEHLSNAQGNDVDGTHDFYGKGILVAQDPPRHTALRTAVRRTFAQREILAREDGIRQLVEKLAADMRAAGGGDLTTDFALPLSISLALGTLGLDQSKGPQYIEHLWRAMARTVGLKGLSEDAAQANAETEEDIAAFVVEHRAAMAAGADTSGSQAINQILLATEKGKVFEDEQIGLAHLVLSAAEDAPAAFVTNMVAILDKFPALQPYLRENPEVIPQFLEESLRFDTPGQNLSRQTTTDVTIAGTTIPADSRVMFLQNSANRDERIYDDPDTFDITREFTPKNRIMTFGEGIHSCMGAPLARLAGRIAIETLLDGPRFRIVGTPQRWTKQLVRGFSSLPIRFD